MATAPPNKQPAAPSGQLAPDQLQALERIVKQASTVLLDEDTAYYIVNKAKQGDPKAVVVEVVMPLLQKIYDTATEANAKVDMVTVVAAGIAIVALVANMLESEGVINEQDIPQFCAAVVKIAADKHNATMTERQAQAGGNPQAAPQPQNAPAPAGGGMMNQGVPA